VNTGRCHRGLLIGGFSWRFFSAMLKQSPPPFSAQLVVSPTAVEAVSAGETARKLGLGVLAAIREGSISGGESNCENVNAQALPPGVCADVNPQERLLVQSGFRRHAGW